VSTEHLDVLIIGAGLSGIGAGAYLEKECPWATYSILESRQSMGGTWDLFRYPGVRSDSDMYTLGYSFRPWDGEKQIADGPSILQYIKDTAKETGVDEHIRFEHRVIRAEWSTPDACWNITAEQTKTGELVNFTCGFVYGCSGYYRYDHGYLPEFAGMERFSGTIVHPQAWPEDLDYEGKNVVVIGSGATAVTLIPSLAGQAAHVTMLQRSPTYIVSLPAKNPMAKLLRRVLPDRIAASTIRWINALATQSSYHLSKWRPELVKRVVLRGVKRQLPAGYDIETHFTPHYNPWDQRMCMVPDGDLFKALRAGTASVVTDHIETFTERGILLKSGVELDADIIVTATGLELLFCGGVDLSVDSEPVELSSKLTYKGMMLEGVPNFAMAIGYTNASWTLKCDLTCDYVCRLLNYMRETGQRQCVPVNRDDAAEVVGEPLLGLNSGYMLRAKDRLPQQGSRYPWRVHQNYLRDYRALKKSAVDGDAMEFSNRAEKVLADAATR
jgi:monooxygenase